MIKKLLVIFSLLSVASTQSCGEISVSSGLIFNGFKSARGDFPFLVALFRHEDGMFFCAANLLTKKHALSVAHCFRSKNSPKSLDAEDIYAVLGKYDLGKSHERGSVTREIKLIIVHDEWNKNTKKYDADISILIFEQEVEFSRYIQPICLPPSDWKLTNGIIAGWGVSDSTNFRSLENITRKVEISAPVDNEQCFLDNAGLAELSSQRTFCAGSNEKGPCKGDSGGGFFSLVASKWYLQGIISASLINSQGQCNVSIYAIYTNVLSFREWIFEKTGSESASTPSNKCPNGAPISTYPHCCFNGAKNIYCCLGSYVNPTCSAPTTTTTRKPVPKCPNDADSSTFPHCCHNGAKNKFCCLGIHINPTCSAPTTTTMSPPLNLRTLPNSIPRNCLLSKYTEKSTLFSSDNVNAIQINGKGEFEISGYEAHQVNNDLSKCGTRFEVELKSRGNSTQKNYQGAVFMEQINMFSNGGFAAQHNSDDSFGNVQVNNGVEGTQFVGSGYSYNLQLNILNCNGEDKSKYSILRGNVRLNLCEGSTYSNSVFERDGVSYKISFENCINDDFFSTNSGKITITHCVEKYFGRNQVLIDWSKSVEPIIPPASRTYVLPQMGVGRQTYVMPQGGATYTVTYGSGCSQGCTRVIS